VQAGCLRQQSGKRGRQAAARCGQEQLYGEMHEGCLERRPASPIRPPLLVRYRPTLTGRSALGASSRLRPVSLQIGWRLGLNGMKGDLLDGSMSSTNRASASDRTIKISASIATTFWIRTAEQRRLESGPVPPKNCDRQHNIAGWVAVISTRLRPLCADVPDCADDESDKKVGA
jgi:hypothetical protein